MIFGQPVYKYIYILLPVVNTAIRSLLAILKIKRKRVDVCYHEIFMKHIS